MTKLKGFALLGRATYQQLMNYKIYYQQYVDIEFTPIWEAHKYLKAWLNREIPTPTDDPILDWCQSREYIANWEFDIKDLSEVMELWVQMKEMQAKGWAPDSRFPEMNRDYVR